MTNQFDDLRRQLRSPVHRAVAAALTLAPAALFGAPAVAQDNAATAGLEEIVVTARKTEEKLTEVPLAIAAFTADDILKRNATSLSDIAQYTAGFSFESYSGAGTPTPLIRGLTQNALTDRNQNVGTFVDGVHVQQQGNIDFSLLDLERIEIVKGPQNAQYGRSSFAGAINWVSAKPTLGDWDGHVTATYGTDDRQDLSAAVSIPLWQDKLAVRIAGKITEFDGTWKNNFAGAAGDNAIPVASQGYTFAGSDGNLGGWDNESRQIALRFRPVDALTLDLMYYRSETQNDVGAGYTIQPRAPRQTPTLGGTNPLNCSPSVAVGALTGFPVGINQLLCGEIKLDENRISTDPRGSGTETHSDLAIGRLSYEFTDTLSATYVYGRGLYDASNFGPSANLPEVILLGDASLPQPGTGFPGIQFAANPSTDQEAESNEIRFDGKVGTITWRLGYYSSKVEDVGTSGFVERRLPLSRDPTGQIFFTQTPLATSFTRFADETTAEFGSIGIPFLDTWTVEAEARHAKEERRQTPLSGAAGPAPREFSEVTPRVNVKWQPQAGWMFYGSAAKGTKAGGFNAVSADVATFEPEENVTYELGGKQALMDGRLQLNYSIFFIDWKDLQLSVPDTVASGLFPVGTQEPNFIGNVSGAESKGAEIELIALATDRLRVNFTGSYVESTFDDDVIDTTFGRLCETNGTPACVFLPRTRVGNVPGPLPLGGSPIGGNDLPRTPRSKASLGAEYTLPVGSFELSLRGDLNYQSKYYVENLNLAVIPDRTLLNLNVSLSDPDRRWLANLWAQNVTDELYASSAFAVSVINQYGPAIGYGRMAGLTVRYNF